MKSKKQIMGRKTELACLLSLLLLVLLHLEISACFAEGYNGKSGRFRSKVSYSHHQHHQQLSNAKSQNGFQKNINAEEDYNKNGADEVFGVEKRKVYTGPNPLHNR
ncbi:hypothetical protein TorRG33x02_035790 [Trema orientale]|uniref:CLAVATA3/ESR (CLE)-related protein n=1 Tax=Trema orientale TaxID=63057 RepID=A0A2P5FRR5_TREOI|nr:hypothetical protein TorRG33x02_035790 [Trema orientale]